MMRLRDLPIGRKLVVVALASSAVALAVSSAIVLAVSYSSMKRNILAEFEAQTSIVADNAASSVAFEDRRTAIETLNSLRLMPSVDKACLFSTVFSATPVPFATYVSALAPDACPSLPPPDGQNTSGDAIVVVKPVTNEGRRHGTLMIQGNLRQARARLSALAVATGGAVIFGVIAAIVLSARMQRMVSEPIRDLSSTASTISARGDYSLRATRHGTDEIGQLVDTFNGMVAEVERRDEQLRAASRLKDEFLAALSHELRTPLNAVLGWVQVLRAGESSPEILQRAHESIERNARAQATLIEDLLDISRIVTGKLNLKSETVDLTTVVEAALEAVRPAADAKEIMIHRALAPSPQFVIGDGDRLQQIAGNLLSNAVKFTGKGGRVDVSLTPCDNTLELEVRDDGAGIEPSFLPHVFDRFRQADGSLVRRHGGLGLGLSIVRELTERHGGRVSAASDGPGRGATLTVVLPCAADAQHAPRRAGAAGAGELQDIRVLVVDDDDDARELAAMAITNAGGTAIAVESAASAAEMLASQQFDVILSDLAMPNTDGFAFLRSLRDDTATVAGRTPVIAVTAHAGATAERARLHGFDAVVTKPYDLETLFSAVRRAAGRDGAGGRSGRSLP
jgi:signal transduction histidine kinase/ActR/RegA family two-component response regulator